MVNHLANKILDLENEQTLLFMIMVELQQKQIDEMLGIAQY